MGIGVLTFLSELAPGVFKTVFLMIILLPVILVALVVKVVPIAASAVGWGEWLGLVVTADRISHPFLAGVLREYMKVNINQAISIADIYQEIEEVARNMYYSP